MPDLTAGVILATPGAGRPTLQRNNGSMKGLNDEGKELFPLGGNVTFSGFMH
jgi:hypothetical protein